MKGKFGIAALIFSAIAFAAPVSIPKQPTVDYAIDATTIQFSSPISTPSMLNDNPIFKAASALQFLTGGTACKLKYAGITYFFRAPCSVALKCNEDGTYCAWGNDCNKDWAYASVRLDGNTIYWYATWYGNKWNRPSSAVSTIEQCGEARQVLYYGARVYDPYWGCDKYVCERWCYDYWEGYYCCQWRCLSYSYGCHGGLYLEGKCYSGGEWVALMTVYTEPRNQ